MKAVIFDCFGVLATDIWLAFCDSLPETADVARARDLNKAFDRGMITLEEFVVGVEQATGYKPPDIEHLQAGQMAKNTQLIEFIRTLKPKYKIGMLSNISSDWITRELLTEEEQGLFDSMIFSYEVGMIKPDPRIYMLACERLRVGPHEALMVDDRQGYIDAAVAEGLNGLVYTDFQTFSAQIKELLNPN